MNKKYLQIGCAFLINVTYLNSKWRFKTWEIGPISDAFGDKLVKDMTEEELEPYFICLCWYCLYSGDNEEYLKHTDAFIRFYATMEEFQP